MSFIYFNRNIPDEAHKKIAEMGPAGVQAFAFAPSGGWVLVVNNRCFARGIPDKCFQQLGIFINAGQKIRVIAFPPDGGNRWLIVTDQTYFARNIPDDCYHKLQEMWNAGARPTSVAFPYPGGNRWVILAGGTLLAHGIDDECFQRLVNYSQGLRPAQRVAFTPAGGWLILAHDRYFARNIPDECYQTMGGFAATMELEHVNFAPNGGWSIISNTARPSYAADPLRDFENRIFQSGASWQSIWDRMAFYQVPGVAIATVKNNQVAWACSYGQTRKNSPHWVHNDTLFQAASCSKPVAGIGFLRLVQSGLIGLHDDVHPKLGWNLPQRACVQKEWPAKVTLFRLLRHEGGIIGRNATNPTDQCSNFTQDGAGGGFSGYPNVANVGVPTVKEILAGTSTRPGVTVNSHKIELVYDPGSINAYSGEGFVMMMQLLENQRGMAFGDWMDANVLALAGMSYSTYSLAAPSFSGPPAAGHDVNGDPIAGDRNRYPEGAAAGLYTTPSDVGRFIIAINQGGTIDGQVVLDNTLSTALMANSLGMSTGNAGTDTAWFSHNGANAGFRCEFKGYPGKQAGWVIMTNGASGADLYNEIRTALIRAYGWE
jgi:CubicO group peptidase (beta-lactamase class C family)